MCEECLELKVVIIGRSYVGKTCVMQRAVYKEFITETTPTLGAAFASKFVNVKGKKIEYQLWDTAGQERYRGMTPMYFRGAHVALIVYAVNDIDSFDDVKTWNKILQDNTDVSIELFLVANKIDLEKERVIPTETGEKLAKEIGANYYETSAMTGEGIDNLFEEIGKVFVEKPLLRCRSNKKIDKIERKLTVYQEQAPITSSYRCCNW